jgi:hypothetical protein
MDRVIFIDLEDDDDIVISLSFGMGCEFGDNGVRVLNGKMTMIFGCCWIKCTSLAKSWT